MFVHVLHSLRRMLVVFIACDGDDDHMCVATTYDSCVCVYAEPKRNKTCSEHHKPAYNTDIARPEISLPKSHTSSPAENEYTCCNRCASRMHGHVLGLTLNDDSSFNIMVHTYRMCMRVAKVYGRTDFTYIVLHSSHIRIHTHAIMWLFNPPFWCCSRVCTRCTMTVKARKLASCWVGPKYLIFWVFNWINYGTIMEVWNHPILLQFLSRFF